MIGLVAWAWIWNYVQKFGFGFDFVGISITFGLGMSMSSDFFSFWLWWYYLFQLKRVYRMVDNHHNCRLFIHRMDPTNLGPGFCFYLVSVSRQTMIFLSLMNKISNFSLVCNFNINWWTSWAWVSVNVLCFFTIDFNVFYFCEADNLNIEYV